MIRFNEGGRGLIVVLEKESLYLCFWTRWIAPRLYIVFPKIKVSFDP